MPARPAEWLLITLNAVRDAMSRRLEAHSLDAGSEREMQLAIEMLGLMWEELVGRHESLDREQHRFEQIFDHVPDGCAITDAGCNVREANLALAELLGVPREQLVGQPLTHWVVEDDRARFLARFIGLEIAPHEPPATFACRLRRADGKPVGVRVSVRAIPLRKSGAPGLCWLFRESP